MSSSTPPNFIAPRHPSSLMMSRPPPVSLQAPDLELKISSVARQTEQAAAGPSPRAPFFGTIRVT
jgi:hypothetical protein